MKDSTGSYGQSSSLQILNTGEKFFFFFLAEVDSLPKIWMSSSVNGRILCILEPGVGIREKIGKDK